MKAGCLDAATLLRDGMACPLASLLTSWTSSGHEEREFQKRLDHLYVAFVHLRWCRQHCEIQPDLIKIALKDASHETGVIWPWDILNWLWREDKLTMWMHDPPEEAEARVQEYWQNLRHMDFYRALKLEDPARTIPISWHCDGVKVYRTQKVWVYSFTSCIRKGPSVSSKILFLIIRENEMVKDKTHDSVAKVISYVMKVLMTGKFPQHGPDGKPWPCGSLAEQRAGQEIAGSWRFAFSTFKADLEARVACHKLVRNYASNSICEHCLASKLNNGFSYGDFTDEAGYFGTMLSHDDFLLLNPAGRQSAWLSVPGWQKDRNVDATCIIRPPLSFTYDALNLCMKFRIESNN